MKKGSALLIVLGMLSFMLFSGIAFSVYMRQTRLPSSFLRRTTITRQLAKAALAEVADDIDRSIGDDPHPGVRRNDTSRNYWHHRVLVGDQADWNNRMGYCGGDTISTLTLEGLAYVPPSLINDARFFSRHTQTAKWHKFRFDAGRYAYTAIDVSDYFDVNRAFANRPRSSSSSSRVTLAHIFEGSEGELHDSPGSGEAKKWDDLLENSGVRKVNGTTKEIDFSGCMPLVSIADFNLLLGGNEFGYIKSPFVDYLRTDHVAFYADAGQNDNDAQAEAYRSMTFVTDSYFRKALEDEYDLEKEENQPFSKADLENENLQLPELLENFDRRPRVSEYLNLLSFIGAATLYDYLDENSTPISLTLPTVERNPMICAISPEFKGVPFTVTRAMDDLKNKDGGKLDDDDDESATREVSQSVTYSIDGTSLNDIDGSSFINALAVYPFRNADDPDSYSLDGKLGFFLCRAGKKPNLVGGTRNANAAFAFGKNPPDKAEMDADGVFSVPLSGMINAPSSVKSEDEALQTLTIRCKGTDGFGEMFSDEIGKHWVKFTCTWTQKRKRDDYGNWTPWSPAYEAAKDKVLDVKRSECRWWPLENDGNAMDKNVEEIYKDFQNGVSYSVGMSVALRIKNREEGTTVDMVPASVRDDQQQGLMTSGDFDLNQYLSVYYDGNGSVEGCGRHIMRFDMGSFVPGEITDKKNTELTASPEAVMVADPRYNHNPANWFIISGGDLKSTWKSQNAASGRDGDIFMAVSNQGYLQSIYELAFLPRLTSGNGKNQSVVGDFNFLSAAVKDRFCNSFNETQQSHLMWKTYQPYKRNGSSADRFADLGFVSGLKGLKVNPFSDSFEVLAAAFANTPRDWSYASTNVEMNAHCNDDAAAFNKKYAWNAYGASDTRISWSRLQDIADDFQVGVQEQVRSGNCDWETAYENLDWSQILDGNSQNGGAASSGNNSKMTSVDKKFLYGFWHDCFAANQQLFLVFVRAEPMMMGGGVAGNAPPQLSSRAVALIWRDPEARKVSSGESQNGDTQSYIPHAMRVLFYHPLD